MCLWVYFLLVYIGVSMKSIFIYHAWAMDDGYWFIGTPEEVEKKKDWVNDSDTWYWSDREPSRWLNKYA